MKARVLITPKRGIADPQGTAIEQALHALGFTDVRGARMGKCIELELPDGDRDAARDTLARMSEQLLANTNIEQYTCAILDEDV
jgi:phosphoribosylformylglycinamidine synthase